jgi:hypothetical protein
LSGSEVELFVRPAIAIRKLGFKPWFERQLIESHVYLVTSFLSLILVLAAFEELSSGAAGPDRAGMLALIVAGTAIGILSWDRYRVILFRALRFSERSACEKCRTYARYDVVDSARTDRQEDEAVRASGSWLRVKCKNCGHEWVVG